MLFIQLLQKGLHFCYNAYFTGFVINICNLQPMAQQLIHYFLHLVFPGLVAFFVYRKQWGPVYLVFLGTMMVDLDHLLADPIFSACRCSINFHPLHSTWAILVYLLLLLNKHTRIVAIGLLMHMATDAIDCWFIAKNC
jgi:hypothetical protein